MKIFYTALRACLTIILLTFLILTSQSCKEKTAPPKLSTNAAGNITTNTAVSGGVITDDGGLPVTSMGVCWNISEDVTIENNKTTEIPQSTSFTSNLTGLLPKTKYYIKAYATNEAGTGYGNTEIFTTLGDVPVSNTPGITEIQHNSAKLVAYVNPNSLPTKIYFEWGATPGYGNTIEYSQNPLIGSNILSLTTDISGLAPGTTYYVRIKSENSLGITYSEGASFKTLGNTPSLTIQPAGNIRTRSATFNGSVNPNYASSTAIFEWGETTAFGNSVTAAQSPVTGYLPVNVSADVSGLLPGTVYYTRVKSENSLGTAYSGNTSFKTAELEWLTTSDFPGTARCRPLCFEYNGKGYYGLGSNPLSGESLHDFWSFDPASASWTRLSDCPYTFINGLTSRCVVGSTVYVFKEWSLYSYNINLDTWQFLRNTSIPLSAVSGFSINGIPYFYIRSNAELYEYNPEANTLYKKAAMINNYLNWGMDETFVINNEAFLFHKNDTKVEVYHYISQSDTWEKKTEISCANPAFQTASFLITLDNCAFIGESTSFVTSSPDENATVTPVMPSSNVWKYDPVKNEIIKCPDLPGVFRAFCGNFSFSNTGYVIGGVTVDPVSQHFVYLRDILIMNR